MSQKDHYIHWAKLIFCKSMVTNISYSIYFLTVLIVSPLSYSIILTRIVAQLMIWYLFILTSFKKAWHDIRSLPNLWIFSNSQ